MFFKKVGVFFLFLLIFMLFMNSPIHSNIQQNIDLKFHFNHYYQQAEKYLNSGKYSQALNYYEQALETIIKTDSKNEQAKCLRSIGATYWYLGNYLKSSQYYLQALDLAKQTGNKEEQTKCLRNIGLVYWNLGDYPEALKYYQQALDISRETGDKKGQGKCLISIGMIFRKTGNYIKALKYYDQALEIFRKIGDKINEGRCLNSVGIIYWYLGNYTKALEYYKQALNIVRRINDKQEEGRILNNIGIIYRHLDDYPKALEYYSQALKITQQTGDKKDEGRWLNNLGNVYFDQGNYEQSLNYYQQSLNLLQGINDRASMANLANNLGLVYTQLNDYSRAIEYCQQALKISQETGQSHILWEAYFDLAQAYEKQGEYDLAFKHYEKAIKVVESLRNRIQLADYKSGFLRDKIEVYHAVINLLAKLNQNRPSEEYDKLAFNYAERGKARAFLDALAESKLEIEKGVDPKLLAREKEIMQEISRTYTDLVNSNLSEVERKEMLAQLDLLEDKLEEIKRELIQKSPAYARLKYPEPITLDQAQKELLDGKSAFLEYSLGKENSYLFVVTKNNFKMIQLPSQKKTEKQVSNYLSFISLPPTSSNKSDLEAVYSSGYNLFKTLIFPALGEIEGKNKLYIIPDGILNYLPFETLILEARSKKQKAGKEIRYLIQNYEIAYIPSGSVLREIIAREERKPVRRQKDLLAVGDPVFGKAEFTGNKEQFIIRSLYSDAGFKFDRLKFSGIEVNKIASLFSKKKRDVYLRKEAKEEMIKLNDLKKYKILHFATHGFIDDAKPTRSAVVLTLDEDPTEDGFLQMREIFNLDLKADLVTLSACQTGLGKFIRGEGIVGFSRAFFYAGASSVLMTLWTVNDQAAAQFMERFYFHLKSSQPKLKALRKVKLEMINSKTALAHPYYWAGFIISGQSEGVVIKSIWSELIKLIKIGFFLGGVFIFIFFVLRREDKKQSTPIIHDIFS
ncbi:MAG: tetratricopeptide repeat protein [Candidatus Aminicenantia bacterium]